MSKDAMMNANEKASDLVLYRSKDGSVQMDVQLERDTIWLSQKQMSILFDKDTDTIGLHIRNLYKEGELEKSSTTEESSVVQREGHRKVTRKVNFYNLDVIISVGYRVKSLRGTEFRIWATNVLKQHIVQGYTVNQKRLKELQQTVKLVSDITKRKKLSGDEASVLLQTVSEYVGALDLLDDYDHQRVTWDDERTTGAPVSNRENFLEAAGCLFNKLRVMADSTCNRETLDADRISLQDDIVGIMKGSERDEDPGEERISRYSELATTKAYGETSIDDYKSDDWFDVAVRTRRRNHRPAGKGVPGKRKTFHFKPGYLKSDWFKFQNAVDGYVETTKAILCETPEIAEEYRG